MRSGFIFLEILANLIITNSMSENFSITQLFNYKKIFYLYRNSYFLKTDIPMYYPATNSYS